MIAGEIVAKFTADMAPYIAAMGAGARATEKFTQEVEKNTKKTSQAISQMNTEVRSLMGMFGNMFSVAGLVLFVRQVINVNDRLQDLADQTGFSAQTLSGYRTTLENAGVSVDMFARGIMMAQRNLGTVDSETDKAAKALERLGLNVQAVQNLTPEQFFDAFAEGLSKIESQTQKVTIAAALFNRGGAAMANAMVQLADASLKTSGASAETIRMLGDLADMFNTLYIAVQNFIATDLTSFFQRAVIEIRAFIPVLQKLIDLFLDFQATLPKFAFQQKLIDALGLENAQKVLKDVGTALDDFNKKHLDPFGGKLDRWAQEQARITGAIGAGGGPGFADPKALEQVTKSLRDQIRGVEGQILAYNKGAEAAERFKIVEDALATLKSKTLTPAVKALVDEYMRLWKVFNDIEETGKRFTAMMKEMEAEIDLETKLQKQWNDEQQKTLDLMGKIADENEAMKEKVRSRGEDANKLIKDLGVQNQLTGIGLMPGLTQGEQMAKQIAQVTVEFEKERRELERLRTVWEDNDAVIAQVDAALSLLSQKQAAAIRNIEQGPAMELFDTMADSITGGIQTAINGVIQGTQTLGQAMAKMGQSIALSFITEFNKQFIIQPLMAGLKTFLFGLTGSLSTSTIPTLGPGTTFTAGGAFQSIPFMRAQTGGTVPGFRGAAVPILAHAGEKIIPLSHADKTGGGNVQVNINGDIIPRRADWTRASIVEVVRQDLDGRGPTMATIESRMSKK